MVVAGLPPLATALGAAASMAAAPAKAPTAPAATTAPGTGLGVGAPDARTGVAAGRLGLTVMRAVSFGGADLTTVVPVFALGSASGVAGVSAAGLSGATGAGG